MRLLSKVITVLLVFCLCACQSQTKEMSSFIHKEDFLDVGKLKDDWHQYRVVAHALGGIEGEIDYTNTYEALVENYNKGTRVFEVDLNTTSDGETILLHEWQQYHETFSLGERQGWEAEDSSFFLNEPIYGKYTPMTLDDLLDIMRIIPDFYLVIDSKTFDVESSEKMYHLLIEKAADKKIIKRIIPQAYTFEIYEALKKMDAFDDIIFTCYGIYDQSNGEEIFRFIEQQHIRSVVMHMDNDWAAKVIRDIRDYAKYSGEWNYDNFEIYIHTVNDPLVANKIITEEEFHGIYSDFISEKDFNGTSFSQ